jgi:hypothetical protein
MSKGSVQDLLTDFCGVKVGLGSIMSSAQDANTNAHLAAHDTATGQLPCRRGISR